MMELNNASVSPKASKHMECNKLGLLGGLDG